MYRPTWLEINLTALAHNLALARALMPSQTRLIAQVKANAYGHGLVPISQALQSLGVEAFGVASLEEALMLRANGVTQMILVQAPVAPSHAAAVIESGVHQTVCTRELAAALNSAAARQGIRTAVHVKVDTGMGRLGIWHAEALPFIRWIVRLPHVELAGTYTHLAAADTDPAMMQEQLRAFDALLAQLAAEGIAPPWRHAANSMGLMAFPHSQYTAVRPGLMLYGLHPHPQQEPRVALQPILQWKTRALFVKQIPAGRPISYGCTYRAARPTTVATLPVGYGDGYPRLASNRGEVIIKGHRCPVVGTICMDQMMVDVGSLPVVPGDAVTLVGTQDGQHVTATALAVWAQTIPYEVFTGLSERLPRVYLPELPPKLPVEFSSRFEVQGSRVTP